ncbi:MBG domain-containing protein [Prosthecobacter sp.]|uniref:MBG domain-containing protein n=1 Tax=Prosthecobacter sp. TaxID=1965333 RepID=UPI002AB8E47D|nr:MBG domain-containing protein [Prosthecobacter sp.]MDZ4402135.1 MBG domain-containing protein [Prosthecobacter sp.]
MVLCSFRLSGLHLFIASLFAMATAAFAAPPAAPTNFAASMTYKTSATMAWRFSWTDNSTDEDGFRLFYRYGGPSGVQGVYGDLPVSADIKAATGPLSITVDFPSNGFGTGWYVEWYVAAYKSSPAEQSSTSNSATYSSWPGPQAPTLTAPSNLAATAIGDGVFRITYNDNSNSEQYFQLDYKKTADSTWLSTAIDFNLTTQDVGGYQARTVSTDMFLPNFIPGTSYNFRLRAVDWSNNVSAYTSTVTAATQAFKAPTGLSATRVGENTFNLAFTNNSTAESGYEFQFRAVGSGTWTTLGNVDDPFFNTINSGQLEAGINYEFQVRAYIRSTNVVTDTPTTYSSFAGPATGTTLFNPPTNLVATSPSEGKVNLTWTDNSSIEGNYEVQWRVLGAPTFEVYGYYAANTASLSNQLIAPGKTLEFRVRATRGSQAEITSAFTSTAEVTTAFNAPTNLVATASTTTPYLISFTWTDNSAVETDYELQFRKQGGTFETRKIIFANSGTAPNSMSLANLPEFDPGSIYEFQLRANYTLLNGTVFATSAFTSISTTTTKNGFSSKPYAPITQGVPFSYQMATLSQQSRTDWTVGTLPAGLDFNSTTGVISGTPTVAGAFSVPMTANFTGGTSHVLNLDLRILRPPAAPQIAQAIDPQTIAASSNASIDLATKFSDLDTDAAVRMATSKGNIDIILYSSLTPGTVTNFLAYDYADTLFHRAPANFVVQGGGYRSFDSPDVFESITRQSPITNEPGVTNTVGTVAMAKTGDDPNSATSEFFFSLGDNSANLDNQNGGFTVFGRVSTPSLSGALTALANIPTSSYNVKLREGGVTPTSTNFSFTNIPIDQTPVPASIDQTKLMKVTSVTSLPVLTYAITNAPNSAVATATLNGTSLQITAVAPGTTSLVVAATDVDGNSTPQTVNITVPKFAATVTLAGLAQTYDGTPLSATATTNPTGLAVSFTYDGSSTAPTNAGSYAVVGTIDDAIYEGTNGGTLVIAKAAATVTPGNLAQAYDGSPKPASATTNPSGLTVNFTYDGSATAPTNVGSYAVVGTISDTNYTGSGNGTLVIAKGTATITLGSLAQAYDGSPKPASATTTPAGLTVDLTYDGSATAPSAYGSYVVAATISDANYNGTAGGTLTISGQTASNWRSEHFSPAEITAGLAADDADPDGDGLKNLVEYALGMDPLSRTPALTPTLDANGLTLTFTRPKALPGVTYAAESSDGLGVWFPVTLVLVNDGAVQTLRASDPLSSGNLSRRFIRLVFTPIAP